MSPWRTTAGVGALCGVFGVASESSAHIDLLFPPPRKPGSPDTTLDQRPCGQRSPERTTDRVSEFAPGATLRVVWDVYVQHASYFRLSFDADGDDSFSERMQAPAMPDADDPERLTSGPDESILAYVVDREGALDHVEWDVVLPRQTCDNCTLQLIQFTYGLPLRDATYYQCADIVLAGEAVPEPSTFEPAVLGAAPSPGGSAPTPSEQERPSSGCALAAPAAASSVVAWQPLPVIALLCAAWVRRRRDGRAGAALPPAVHEHPDGL